MLLPQMATVRIAYLVVVLCAGLIAQSPKTLSDVRTIFVDNLGQGEWSTLIRDKIINRLASSSRFEVVLDPAKADAVLTGSADESKSFGFSNGAGGTGYDATAAVRLITKDQVILWVSETKNNRFARSASSSVADHIVKDLLKAASPPKRK